jgi:hypothetical protein
VEHNESPPRLGTEITAMHQLTQLTDDTRRRRLAHAEAQRPAQRLLALAGPPVSYRCHARCDPPARETPVGQASHHSTGRPRQNRLICT